MYLLYIERPRIVSELSYNLHLIPLAEPIDHVAELLRWFVSTACDLAETGVQIEEDMPSLYMPGLGRDLPMEQI